MDPDQREFGGTACSVDFRVHASISRREHGSRREGKEKFLDYVLCCVHKTFCVSPQWGSNPRPYAYEAHALPTEL